MSSEFAEFASRCNTQGTELIPPILRAGQTGTSGFSQSVELNGFYAAIVKAGALLREQPGIPLANKVIKRNALRGFNHNAASRTLTAIINASVDPVPAMSWDTAFTCSSSVQAGACNRAEEYFGATILQMLRPDARLKGHDFIVGHQIIMGDSNQVIALRKGKGVPTCLTFVPVTINNIPYPPGSIMRTKLITEYNGRSYRRSAYSQNRIVPVHEVSHLNFVRLSVFVEPPSRRGEDFKEAVEQTQPGITDSGLKIAQTWSLERVRRITTLAAQKLLSSRSAPSSPAGLSAS